MKSILNTSITPFSLALVLIVTSLFVSRVVPAETIPFKDLVGVWTMSQGGPNHDLTHGQVEDLCGMAVLLFHPDRNLGIHMRWQQDDKLMMSMDVQSNTPCTYAENQLSCEMETTSLGKSLGVSPAFFRYSKVRKGVYDATALNPDGKTGEEVQTMYTCSMTIPEAQAWLEANSGPGEIGEKMSDAFDLIEKANSPKNQKVLALQQKAESGDSQAQAGLGSLYLMAALIELGVEHDPERGIKLLNQAAEKKVASAYVMLGSAYMIPGLAFPKQNFTEAYSWFEKAAQTGRGDALNTAGMMKLFGLGTKQDGIQAIEWITRASELGNPSAHFNLGIIRVFFPKELKQRWKVSLDQDPLMGMMHINLASEQGHEPSKMMLQFLNQKRHPELAYPARAKASLWKNKYPSKVERNTDYPDSNTEMDFKIEGGQIKFMDANINAKLEWSPLAAGSVFNQDKLQKKLSGRIFLPKNGNKQFLLSKWWGVDNCAILFQWDDEGNEYYLYKKENNKNPMQRYINDEWWIASYGKPDIGENKIKGKYIELERNSFSYADANYKFKTKNKKIVLVLEYLEYSYFDEQEKKIKEDVSEWGEMELFECKIGNIRETKEFSDQLEHIKKMFNKK